MSSGKYNDLRGMFSGFQQPQNDNNANQNQAQQATGGASALESFLGSLGSQTNTNQQTNIPASQTAQGSNMMDSQTVAKGIMAKFGPKDRKQYVDNAQEWVNSCLRVEPVIDFVYLMLIACNVLPLNLQTIDTQYNKNKEKFEAFAKKVDETNPLKASDSRPQVNFMEIYTQLKRILQAYPIKKKFEWDSVMSVKQVKEVADYLSNNMNQFNTKVYPFFYFKGIWKSQESTKLAPIVCDHMELWSLFLKWYYATKGNLFNHHESGVTYYPNGKPDSGTASALILDLGNITVSFALNQLKQIVKFNDGKLVDVEKSSIAFLPFIKNLILMNPYRILLTSNFRLARAMGMHADLQDAVVDLMILQIEETMELVSNGTVNIETQYMDQQQRISAEQLMKADKGPDSPNATLLKSMQKIRDDGGFDLEIDGPFMQAYFASQRIQKIFMRSMKRLLFGSGTGPNTRRWNRGQNYTDKRHGIGSDKSTATSEVYSLQKLLARRKA